MHARRSSVALPLARTYVTGSRFKIPPKLQAPRDLRLLSDGSQHPPHPEPSRIARGFTRGDVWRVVLESSLPDSLGLVPRPPRFARRSRRQKPSSRVQQAFDQRCPAFRSVSCAVGARGRIPPAEARALGPRLVLTVTQVQFWETRHTA